MLFHYYFSLLFIIIFITCYFIYNLPSSPVLSKFDENDVLKLKLHHLNLQLSKKSDIILTEKISQTIQMEKDLLLEKNSNDKIANDEYLMKLSSEVRSCTRYAILHQVWKTSYYGILSFTIFTFIGCGMLLAFSKLFCQHLLT